MKRKLSLIKSHDNCTPRRVSWYHNKHSNNAREHLSNSSCVFRANFFIFFISCNSTFSCEKHPWPLPTRSTYLCKILFNCSYSAHRPRKEKSASILSITLANIAHPNMFDTKVDETFIFSLALVPTDTDTKSLLQSQFNITSN